MGVQQVKLLPEILASHMHWFKFQLHHFQIAQVLEPLLPT